jgi:glycosyltransferase involved in cell wall biosynthesis
MNKILIITERFYPENFIINDLATEWQNKGFKVSVLTQNPSYPLDKIFKGYKNNLFKKYDWNGIKIYRFFTILGYKKSKTIKLLNYFSFVVFSVISAIFIGRKVDKIFIYQTGSLTLAIAGIIIKKLYKKPATIWTQDIWPNAVYNYGFKKRWYLTLFLNWLMKFVYSNCNNIFISCRSFKDVISKYISAKQIYYFPNWSLLNLPKKSDKKIKFESKFNFTFAGKIGKLQNLENVILGFKLFLRQGIDARLNIIGDGSHLENLKKLVDEEKIPQVIFLGRKHPDEMYSYFEASDVLVISLKESLTIPSKFQTYLACNKPIFAVMNGDVANLVKQYKVGITALPSDINSIAEGFRKSIKFAEKEKDIKTKTEHFLKTEFSKDKIVTEMTNIINKP